MWRVQAGQRGRYDCFPDGTARLGLLEGCGDADDGRAEGVVTKRNVLRFLRAIFFFFSDE